MRFAAFIAVLAALLLLGNAYWQADGENWTVKHEGVRTGGHTAIQVAVVTGVVTVFRTFMGSKEHQG